MGELVFDLVVIGGGTGGLRAAFHSARNGYKTAIIDPGQLGGTCLNTGCIPTKALLHVSGSYSSINGLDELGIKVSRPQINFRALMSRVNEIVEEGQGHVKKSISIKNLTVIKGKARFLSKKVLQIGTKKAKAKKIIISTGSRSRKLDVEGGKEGDYMVSSDVLKLARLPRSLIIIGAGYIAMEFATFFSQLGVKVTIIGRSSRVLPGVDAEISKSIEEKYSLDGITFNLASEITRLKKLNGKKEITFIQNKKSQSCIAEEVLVAIGRVPNTEELGLEAAGISTAKNGTIKVNKFLETSTKGIYALGDVTGKAPFAHAAKRESLIALWNALKHTKETMPFSQVPWSVFTSPPISGIGRSEEELKKSNIKYNVLTTSFNESGRARVMGIEEGMIKVFYAKKSGKILGAVIFGERADDMIHEFVALFALGANISQLKSLIHVHPTLSEVIGNLREE